MNTAKKLKERVAVVIPFPKKKVPSMKCCRTDLIDWNFRGV